MAQEVEHVLGKDEVTSSNLVISSRKNVPYNEGRFFWSWGASPSKTSLTTRDVFLEPGGISVKFHIMYREEYRFLLQIQPDYIDCQDDSILQPIIDSIPKDLSKTKRIAMGKEKVKALFKYDKTYPRWVQEAEWPIVNGKPLVFSHQKKAKGGDIRTYYYFYDPDTKEQTVVEQFD